MACGIPENREIGWEDSDHNIMTRWGQTRKGALDPRRSLATLKVMECFYNENPHIALTWKPAKWATS